MSPTAEEAKTNQEPCDYYLRKYLLLLATVVATVTYSAGFNPPAGVWQEAGAGHRAGDPIIREIHYIRYAFFYYCNASAFASSLVVAVLILLLALVEDKNNLSIKLLPMRVVMVFDLISLLMAYAAGTCRERFTKLYASLLLAASVAAYLILQVFLASSSGNEATGDSSTRKAPDNEQQKKRRKVLMLLATFAVSLTYYAGLNTPGGFWDNTEEGHRPGDAILKEHHDTRFKAFFVCNTSSFVASLFIMVLLLDKKLHKNGTAGYVLNGCIVVALIGLIGAYAAGSSRRTGTTTYVLTLGLALVILQEIIAKMWSGGDDPGQNNGSSDDALDNGSSDDALDNGSSDDALDKARSLVLLLATLVATITYQAGMDPPGGVWQENGHGHIAGDPVLLTINPRRYKVFFYCNSVAFVASLVVIVLVQRNLLLRHHILEAAMLLDLFGLIGAYAAGSCRDMTTSLYVIAIAGVVLIYVVIHVIFFTLEHREHDEQVEKRRKRLLLFAILACTITYQAGLTPPGGFLLRDDEATGHHAGDPILLYNSGRRYAAFFFCNSASFVMSIVLIILLVNPNVYRPAIRSYAFSVCTAAGLFGLVGAYAIGSTQRRSTTISTIIIASVLLFVLFLLLLMFLAYELGKGKENNPHQPPAIAIVTTPALKKTHAKRKYLMLLGILMASVTYQVGLDQPGGVWQRTADGHLAGNPVMQDLRGRRYKAFFYCNSTALVGSIAIIILLLPPFEKRHKLWLTVMSTTVLLDLLMLLGAYATGSTRDVKTSARVAALIAAVLAYFVIHGTLSYLRSLVSRRIKKGAATAWILSYLRCIFSPLTAATDTAAATASVTPAACWNNLASEQVYPEQVFIVYLSI